MDNINRNEKVIHDNADPITGEPGSHPIGTAVGGTGGAAAGAAIGAIGGPLGMLIGGAIGAIVGGVAGSSVGEMLDPTVEYEYWQETHTSRPYYNTGYNYDTDYHPAYAVGYASRTKYPANARFEDAELELEQRWNEVKGSSRMTWLQAKDMVRDGWDKTQARMNGEVYEPKAYAHYNGHREVINDNGDKPHPVATGTGALGGAAAGAAVGTAVGGPVGTLVGGAVGALAGSKVGHEAGEMVNPTDNLEAHEKPHPIASGTGALGGAAAGAAVGSMAGPVGTVVGGLAGAVAGGAGGQEVGEAVNPTDYNEVQREANPVSSGTGMVGGAAAGAAIGAAGGPLGSVVGGAVGAVVGATAGNAVANAFEGNMEEDNYWRNQHVTTEYYNPQYDYDTDYRSAYGYGYEQRKRYGNDQSFDLLENDLQRDWNNARGQSRLEWVDAKYAVRDAWNRPIR